MKAFTFKDIYDSAPLDMSERELAKFIYDHQQIAIDELQYLSNLQHDRLQELEEFVRFIATDWVELSHDKVRWQRDDYIKRAKELYKS